MKKIMCALFVGLIVGFSVVAEASSYKVDLEESLNQRVQRVLDNIYGPGIFVTRVSTVLSNASYDIKYTQEANPKLNKKEGSKGKVHILPGYPVIKNLSAGDLNKLPFDSVTTYRNPKIRKIVVDVVVNKSFSKGKARRVEPLIREVLNMKAKRDTVKLSFKKFYVKASASSPNMMSLAGNETLMTVQNLFYLLVLVLMAIFMIIYVVLGLKKKPEDKGGKGSGNTSVSVNPNISLPKGAGGAGGKLKMSSSPNIRQYFDFVDDENVDKFIYILKKEKIGANEIAVMVSLIQPDLAKQVLGALEINEKVVIATRLVDQQLIKREMLEKLEKHIKNMMECLVGGKSAFESVFDLVPNDDKKELLGILEQSNPEGYQKFRSMVVVFEDLQYLEDEEIKVVLSEVNLEMLSASMAALDEDVYQKIDSNLTKSAKDMVGQFLELKGEGISKVEIDAAREYVLKIVNDMDKNGKINLRGKFSGSEE
jgi:hypothetical protein